MRVCTVFLAIICHTCATSDVTCGASTCDDYTSLLQTKNKKVHTLMHTAERQGKKTAAHVFDQAMALLTNDAKQTPGIVDRVEEIRTDIAGDAGLFADIQQAHDADQISLNEHWDRVQSARDGVQSNIDDIDDAQTAVDALATIHEECRGQESLLCDPLQQCHTELADAEVALSDAEDLVFATQSLIVNGDSTLDGWCANDGIHELSFRDQTRGTIRLYLAREDVADTKRATYNAKKAQCEALEDGMAQKRDDCNQGQVHFERDSCLLASLVSNDQTSSAETFNVATADYETARDDVEVQEGIRKKEFLTLTRTDCLLERIHMAGELPCDDDTLATSDFPEACHQIEVNTTHLDIDYHDVCTMPAFPEVPSSPCASGFLEHYTDFAAPGTCGGRNVCEPCANAPCPSTLYTELAAQASPDGWSDTTVGMGHGHFTDILMHGPWDLSFLKISRSWPVLGGNNCTVSWTSYGMLTRDGEKDRVWIEGVKIWEQKMPFSHIGISNGGSSFNQTWTGACDSDGDGQITVKWTSKTNEAKTNEAWGFGNVVVSQEGCV